jgi:hypothetical protein
MDAVDAVVEQRVRTCLAATGVRLDADAARRRRASLRRALDAAMPAVVRGATAQICTMAIEVGVHSHDTHSGAVQSEDKLIGDAHRNDTLRGDTQSDDRPRGDAHRGDTLRGDAQSDGAEGGRARPERPQSAAEPASFWAAPGVDVPSTRSGGPASSGPEVVALRAAIATLAGQDPRELPGPVARCSGRRT